METFSIQISAITYLSIETAQHCQNCFRGEDNMADGVLVAQ
jgi:hypothetical protein